MASLGMFDCQCSVEIQGEKYQRGYVFSLDKRNIQILILNIIGEGENYYFIPDFEVTKTTDVAKAIYAVLHSKANRDKILFFKVNRNATEYMRFSSKNSTTDIYGELLKIEMETLK